MADRESNRHKCLYEEWMNIQAKELSDLLQNITRNEEQDSDSYGEESIQLIEKIMKNFKDYIEKRSRMVHLDVSPYFAPPWCSSLENSVMWIGGCRPSSYIRLIYALCGLDIESNFTNILQGIKIGNIGELSCRKLTSIDQLHQKTITQERKLTERKATLEEDVVDTPFAEIARELNRDGESSINVEDEPLAKHGKAMAAIIEEADMLRFDTLKEIVDILTPLQAVEYMAAAKRIRLCLKDLGKKSDEKHGRN